MISRSFEIQEIVKFSRYLDAGFEIFDCCFKTLVYDPNVQHY